MSCNTSSFKHDDSAVTRCCIRVANSKLNAVVFFPTVLPGAVLGIFIWVGQSKAKQTLGRPTEVVYMGIMEMTRTIWVGQQRVWVGHGVPGLIA